MSSGLDSDSQDLTKDAKHTKKATSQPASTRASRPPVARGNDGIFEAIANSTDLSGIPKDVIPHIRNELVPELEDNYIFHEVLGQGAFGIVHRVEMKKGHAMYACKTIKKRIGAPALYEQQMKEVNIMKVIQHDGILKLYEVYESPKKIAMIVEL